MKEAVFIERNKQKWKEIESHLDTAKGIEPDTLASYFIELTDDLAFAKTYYKGSMTSLYINNLATKVHRLIYVNKRSKSAYFLDFWRYKLPLTFYQHRRQILFSLVFLLVCASFGAISSLLDESYVRLILGDDYVDMTISNIEKGDPMGVYKDENSTPMFIRIAYNNIMVSVYAFGMGVIFGIGTLFVLFTNGVMVGSFQAFFYTKGYLAYSASTIWLHGTIEMSAIVIAGAAGLTMGKSLLFPGSYTRAASIQMGIKEGVKMVVGLMPFFIFASFIESYVTRYTEMPIWLNSLIIGASLWFMIFYVYWYPKSLSKKDLSYLQNRS